MIDAVIHHKKIVELLDEMNAQDFDVLTGAEPLSTKARDNAHHLLARRVDLAIGMSVKLSSSGGLSLDFIRNGREYVIEIDSQGRSSLVAGSAPGREPFGMSHSSINQLFLHKLEQEIPDPVRVDKPGYDLIPLAGVVVDNMFGRQDVFDVQAHGRRFVGLSVTNARYGFDTACFPVKDGVALALDKRKETVKRCITSGGTVHLGRRFRQTSLISLHDIMCRPEDILRGSKLSCGCGLERIKLEVIQHRAAAT